MDGHSFTLGAVLCAKMAHIQPIYIKNRGEDEKNKSTRNTFDGKNADEEETGRMKQEICNLNQKQKRKFPPSN